MSATDDMKSPKASIDQLAWIAGHWGGEAMGGRFEETWNPPLAGTMQGMFKFAKDGQVGFYELITIVPAGDSLAMRVKHFTADFVGWEEKDKYVEFRLLKLTDDTAYFDGLTMHRIGPDQMEIVVRISHEGNVSEVPFPCQRVGSTANGKSPR
jgi:hypothetical protein